MKTQVEGISFGRMEFIPPVHFQKLVESMPKLAQLQQQKLKLAICLCVREHMRFGAGTDLSLFSTANISNIY